MSEREEPGLVERTPVHRGRIVDLSLDRVRFPDGSEGTLEFVRHPGAAAVLPVVGRVDESDPEVVLIRQYRYAADGHILEVPAGLRSGPQESWEACAARELEEETGFRAGNLQRLGSVYTTPGFTNEVIHLFLASELERGDAARDDDEFIELVRASFSQAVTWARDGRIRDGKSVCTILLAERFLM